MQVVMTNTGSQSISNWTVVFTLPAGHQFVNTWGANLSMVGNTATATGVSFNSALGAGQSAFWGFQASRPNDGQLASGFSCATS